MHALSKEKVNAMMQEHSTIKGFMIGVLVVLVGLSAAGLAKVHARDGSDRVSRLDEQQIKTAVETWVRTWTPDARPDAVVRSLEPYQEDGETFAYIAHLSGKGFCLCGADKLVLPVTYYSPQGKYDPGSPGCRYLLQEIAARQKYLRTALARNDPELRPYMSELRARASDWSELARGRTPVTRPNGRQMPVPIAMELDLSCKWHQGTPYNDDLPSLSPNPPWDEPAVVGCNATAMAQTMYYWQWPWQGVGQHKWYYDIRWRTIGTWDSEPLAKDPGIPSKWPAYQVGDAKYERLRWNKSTQCLEMTGYWDESLYSVARGLNAKYPAYLTALENLWNRLNLLQKGYTVDPGNTTYDWSLLKDKHVDPPGPDDQEVAELCNHVSNTIESGWGIAGTGSCHVNQAKALKTYFRYDSDAKEVVTDPNVIVEEIAWLRPAGQGGTTAIVDGAGHAWVIHGYDASYPNWRFLMNMGWDGNDDGWHTLDNVPGGFHLLQTNLIHVAPLSVRFVGNTALGDGSPDSPFKDIDAALASVPDYTTLIFKAGSVNTFGGSSVVIDRPMTLKGYYAVID